MMMKRNNVSSFDTSLRESINLDKFDMPNSPTKITKNKTMVENLRRKDIIANFEKKEVKLIIEDC